MSSEWRSGAGLVSALGCGRRGGAHQLLTWYPRTPLFFAFTSPAPDLLTNSAVVAPSLRSLKLRYDAGLKAKELLLKSNYKLVMTVCKSFVGKGPHIQDLVSEGVKGLLKGVEKYDATKGFRFGTYAHWWIRQAVSRSLAETGRAVRCVVVYRMYGGRWGLTLAGDQCGSAIFEVHCAGAGLKLRAHLLCATFMACARSSRCVVQRPSHCAL